MDRFPSRTRRSARRHKQWRAYFEAPTTVPKPLPGRARLLRRYLRWMRLYALLYPIGLITIPGFLAADRKIWRFIAWYEQALEEKEARSLIEQTTQA